MEGTSGISEQQDTEQFDALNINNQEQGWRVELNNVNTDQNGWRVQTNNTIDQNSIVDANGQFKPEVRNTLNNFIGTMAIEMVKKQNPTQKISLDDE